MSENQALPPLPSQEECEACECTYYTADQMRAYAQAARALAEQEPARWVAVSERLPDSGLVVLACYTNRSSQVRRIRANWIAAKSSEASIDYSECAEYDEATDTYYDPEGWYERIDNWGDYSAVAVCEGDVTHWMPLPEPPSANGLAAAPKGQIEAAWIAGYYHAGYTHDSAYADKMAAEYAAAPINLPPAETNP